MSLDIWFRDDIKHILMAAERASSLSLAQAEESGSDASLLRAYRRGYRAALCAVAVACGLTPHEDDGEASSLLRGGAQ
ncbi:MAG: hypothetical protein QME94_15310 [Anaerolineae bacterium]|nr:hypothetical protein [Anaerolineae bacterium]